MRAVRTLAGSGGQSIVLESEATNDAHKQTDTCRADDTDVEVFKRDTAVEGGTMTQIGGGGE